MRKVSGLLLFNFLIIIGCRFPQSDNETNCHRQVPFSAEIFTQNNLISTESDISGSPTPSQDPPWELKLQDLGLVDIQTYVPDAIVWIRYADSSNFTGKPIYRGLKKCYLQNLAAEKLKKANELLKSEFPQLRFLIWDCARPLSAQKRLWNEAPLTKAEKWKYLSNPDQGSVHNFGLAIDLTLADSSGRMLDMGTDFDYFGEAAQPIREVESVMQGIISESALKNRKLLRKIMRRAGFSYIPHEWWHFNALPREEAIRRYSLLP